MKMKRSSSDRLLRYFFYLILLLIGGLVGFALRHYQSIPVSETINLVDVAALIVTIFLAVYIPEVLDRKLQILRDKKELIEGRIEEYQGLMRRINMLIQNNRKLSGNDLLLVWNLLDVSGHKLDTIVSLLNYAKITGSFECDIQKIKQLNKEHREILRSDQMSNDDFQYSVEIQVKEEELYNQLDKMTSILIFKLSEAK